MDIIKGNYEEVKQKILKEYQNSDQSICEWFNTVKCVDLTIDEVVKLYAELRYECDGDITCNIVSAQSIMILRNGDNTDLRSLIDEVSEI